MSTQRRSSRWLRLSVVVLGVAVVPLLLSSAGGAATGKPDTVGRSSEVSVVTLTGVPATIRTPGELYELEFSPGSAATFTQQPGEVVTVTMAASWDMPNGGTLFCDLHTAVNLQNAVFRDDTTALRQNWLAQRGDDWWRMSQEGRDLTRTVPAPAIATEHTLIGLTWMDEPGLLGGDPAEDPESLDPGDCYGTSYGFDYQEVTATVRVSLVKMRS